MAAEDYAGMGLSDEEIAAIDEPEDETTPPVDEDVSDELDDDDSGEEADETPAPEPAQAPVPDPAPAPAHAPAPYIPPVPEGAAERLAALEQEIATIKQQRSNGVIDFDDADDKLDALRDERADIRADLKAVEIAARAAEHHAAHAWEAAQIAFFGANEAYRTDPLRYAALDAAVKAVASEPETDGKDLGWILNEAKDRVEKAFGGAPHTPSNSPPARRDVPPDIPPTLGGLPAAGANSTSKDGFAHLESLTGLELEMALARMSDAEQAAYLGG